MAPPTSYGSVSVSIDETSSQPTSSCSHVLKSAFTLVVLALVVAFLVIEFGAAAVAIGLGVALAVVFFVTFLAFCAVARSLVRSVFMIPFVALRLQLNILSTSLAYALRGFRPLYPQWTLTFEITCKMMRFMFEEYGEIIAFENAALMREPFAMHGRLILKSNCRKHNTRPEQIHVNGMDHMWLRDSDERQQRIVVIHYHGGGFAMSDPLQDVELANQTHSMLQQILRSKYQLDVSVDVLLSNYRKSPENPFPTPDNDCLDMYKYVLKHENISPDHVLFSGDSAGAKMSLVNCMRMRDSTPELLPLGCLLYSPSVDFDEKGGDEKTPDCIMPSAFVDAVHQTYLANVTDPDERLKVSPINGDLRNLPPMFVQYGTLERFYEQGMRIVAKAKKQGVVNWEVDLLENMPHDAVMLPTNVSPAAKEGIRHGCEFAAKLAAAVLFKEPEPEVTN